MQEISFLFFTFLLFFFPSLLSFSIKQIVGDFLNFYTAFIAVLDSRFTWSRNVEPPRLLSDFVVQGTKLSLPSIHLRHSCATFSSRILRRVFYVLATELPLKDENCGCNCSLCFEEIYRGSISEGIPTADLSIETSRSKLKRIIFLFQILT